MRAVAKDGSVSARLRAVEENLRRVDDRITSAEQELHREIQEVQGSITSEQAQRQQGDASLAQRHEHISTGGLDSEVVGIAWVIVGQAFGSLPAEIACEIARVFGR
ncbi:MAG: hypothetical protein ACR2M1_01795 [Gemmatimonadaceae bacterium]